VVITDSERIDLDVINNGQLRLLAGPELGRTIPLADMREAAFAAMQGPDLSIAGALLRQTALNLSSTRVSDTLRGGEVQ
jgi:hypothetical protein